VFGAGIQKTRDSSDPLTSMNEDQRKYFEMLQSVIARLAGNSFSIKGWAVALVAVLGGFAAKDADPRFVLGLWLPAFCFWGLDAFYLHQERLFRALYIAATAPNSKVSVYSMDTSPFATSSPSVMKIAFSRTIVWLHLPILTFVLALSAYSIYRHIDVAPAAATPASHSDRESNNRPSMTAK